MERTETRSRDELLNLYSIQEIDVANIRKVGKDIVPRLEEILSGEARISDVRALRVEDLLGREV